jgi:acetyltransferase-like isoleucine patch superfamily enzyme
LKWRNEGLILGEGVTARNVTFGRYNMICARATVANTKLGDFSYVGIGSKISGATIGNYCSIGPDVLINLGIHPAKDFVSTHPIFYSTSFPCQTRFADHQAFEEYGTIDIGHDVWIGARVVVSPNVSIGTGAILATGAVVTKDVEPYSIVGGVPAAPIRKRFDEATIERLLSSKWWELSHEELANNHQSFHNIQAFNQYWESRSSQ